MATVLPSLQEKTRAYDTGSGRDKPVPCVAQERFRMVEDIAFQLREGK